MNPQGFAKKMTASVAGGQIAGAVGSVAAIAIGRRSSGRTPDLPDFGRVGYVAISEDKIALVKTKMGARRHDRLSYADGAHDAPPPGNLARMTLRLRPLRIEDERAAAAAHSELGEEGFTFLLDWDPGQSWQGYLERTRRTRDGIDLPTDRVPATFLVADVNGSLVGRASIRHELNDFLANEGGHIGYAVRPHHRRRGYATEILRQALVIARAEGIERVLVTCDDGNEPSAAIIERSGGELEDIRPGIDGVAKRRYWIR